MNKDILDKFNLKINKVSIRGNCMILDTDSGKYVLKKENTNYYDYLPVREFINYPDVIKVSDDYVLSKYIDNKEVPDNQRLEDMVYLISILHNHTVFDKKLDIDTIKEKYEDLISRLDELHRYYLSLQDMIEDEEYMSPANYYLIRNISLIYYAIRESRKYLDKWYKDIENTKSIRYVYTHGNLDIDHILEGDKPYLISWNKSKLDLSIRDIEDFYRENFKSIRLDTILRIYSKKYPLKEDELNLLFCLLLIPMKVDMNKKEYPRLEDITDMILYLEDTLEILKNYSKEQNKEPNK